MLFRSGVLEVTLPAPKQPARSRRIRIEGAGTQAAPEAGKDAGAEAVH